MTRITVQFALCLLIGTLVGEILLLNIPLKWEIAIFGVMGIAVFALVVKNIKRILLFLLAFTVPIVFSKAFILSPERFSLAKGVGIDLSDVLVLILLLLFLAEMALRKIEISFFPWVTIPALVWLILSSFSLLAARDEILVVIQLIKMFKLLILCWTVALSIGNEVDVTFAITGLLLGMLFQAVIGIYQGVTGHPVGLGFLGEGITVMRQDLGESLVNRVQGTMGYPNSYALYLTTVIPVGLALLFSKARISLKVLMVMTLCLGVLALIFSLSRSAWITFMVTICIVFALAVRRKLVSLRAAVLVIGAICLALIGMVFFGPEMIINRFTGNDHGSAYSRIILAKTALAIIKDHPWVGVGLNNYALINLSYDPTARHMVHNVYLLIAAETGLVGLMAFLGFLAVLQIQAWRIVNRAPNDTVWVAGVGIFCAFVAVVLMSGVDYSLLGSSQVTTLFGLLAGLSAALSQRMDH